MKRPPGIWILLSAGVLWLSLQDVYGIRATALIFGRSTTTTTPPSPVANATDGILEAEVVTESSSESINSTKTNFTGNPQLDYIFDPNLPKELNGYNLSDYPFYERVPDPEEIDFKCDGLHDGFYASIPYKCQVYHHCLFGTRYDFLCANYTAFDQKTFICQFVSDVDCVGSKKFWHRNDALYKAASTTTLKPLSIYTPPPDPDPASNPAKVGGGGPRGGGKRRRPIQRRPQYDYYDDDDYEDDYYDDRPRSRRRRPRPRPRPVYDDEYDEDYEDYERRNRRPYKRRGGSDRRRNRYKNKNDEDTHKDEEERPKPVRDEEEDYRSSERKKPLRDDIENEKRKPTRGDDSENDRPSDNRKFERDDDEERPLKKKPIRSDRFEDERPNEKRKPPRSDHDDEDYDTKPVRPRKGNRRPSADEDTVEDDRRGSRPRKKVEDDSGPKEEEKTIIKPTTGTIYDRPRVAPKIKPPVPKNAADKYAYKPIAKVTTPTYDEEYYDDYEEDLPPKPRNRPTENDPIKSKSSTIKERQQASTTLRTKPKPSLDQEDDALTLPPKNTKPEKTRGKDRYRSRSQTKTTERPVVEEEPPKKIVGKVTPQPTNERYNNNSKKKNVEPEYYDEDYEIEKTSDEPKVVSSEAPKKKWKPTETTTSTTTQRVTTKATSRTTEAPYEEEDYKERPDQVVRILKRPFLPSRGGNPYSTRNLQPVGSKALTTEVMDAQGSVDIHQKSEQDTDVQENRSQTSKASRQKYNDDPGIRNRQKPVESSEPKFSNPVSEYDNDFKPIKHPQHILRPNFDKNDYNGPRTTQKPKIPDRNPLDINENEYDVTLNDALNPTLPNLPVRFPQGYNTANDYTFSSFQRQRYVLEPVISPGTSDYVYQQKQPVVRQRYEAVPQSYNTRDQYVAPSNDYKNYYNSNTRRGNTQAQTQAFYTTSY